MRGKAIDRTKTKLDQTIALPDEVCAVLDWHIATQLKTDEQEKSEMFFTAKNGRFRCTTSLQGPFAKVATAIGLTKRITPKAGRRTFQDVEAPGFGDEVVKVAYARAVCRSNTRRKKESLLRGLKDDRVRPSS